MELWEKIQLAYPELEKSNSFFDGTICLQNDLDGFGDYIREWNYLKPIPDGLTLGKPTA
jgi:hypothetical protein